MASPDSGGFGAHRRLVITLLVSMLVVIGAESFLLYQQSVSDKARRTQTERLLNTFLRGDSARAGSGTSVQVRLRNVRFIWSPSIYVDAANTAVRAVPAQGTMVDFDDLDSFRLVLQQSVVRIRPDVLAGMFNESIFNYPESRVRNLSVSIAGDDKGPQFVVLKGNVNAVAWIPFTLYTQLSVDTATNTLVITVDHMKVFGIIPATKLIRWTPLHLDRLIALPPNKSLLVDGNRIMVKPFGLFPPPRIDGRIASVAVDGGVISLTFAGDAIPAPTSPTGNYVYLRGGASRFGSYRMIDTDMLIQDQNPTTPFAFSLLHYADLIPRSTIALPNTRSVRITMPDF